MMETKKENLFTKLLAGQLPGMEVNTQVGVTPDSLLKIGATLFITAALIFLAYFTFKKMFQ